MTGAASTPPGQLMILNETGRQAFRVPIFLLEALAQRKILDYFHPGAELALAGPDC